MGEVGLRSVRDGSRVLRFRAAVIGAATSRRGSTPRWSELVVYKLADGSYLISKIGRSTVAHHPACRRVNHRMVRWDRAGELGEDTVPRLPCAECQPQLTPMAPDTRLEITRYRAIVCPTAESAAGILTEDRAALLMPQLVRAVLAQCAQADPEAFSRYADALNAPKAPLEYTTRTP